MKATYLLKGLTCPNCGAKIESEAMEIVGVTSSTLNLLEQQLVLDCEDDADTEHVLRSLTEIVHSHEPDVDVIERLCKCTGHSEDCRCEHCSRCHIDAAEHENDDDNSPWRIRRLIGGGILAVAMIVLHYLIGAESAYKWYLFTGLVVSYLILGEDVLIRAVKNILRGKVFDENFLMALATLSAFVLGEYPEAVAVMLFYQIGEYFQDSAVERSRKAIHSLLDIRPDKAVVLHDGKPAEVSPDQVEVGELILVRPGERVPLDGVVEEGESMLDTRALTGEAVPRRAGVGDNVLSGCINGETALKIRVSKGFSESTASKIVDMVQNAASRKAPAEQFITKFARYYTPVVVILAVLLAIIPPLAGVGAWSECIQRACVFLVISCPCALVISVPLAFFGGLGAASRRGILVKGGNYLEALTRIRTVVFDKTGTLTRGSFDVTGIYPAEGHSEDDILRAAARAELLSNHPIAKSILEAASRREIDAGDVEPCHFSDIAGFGTAIQDGEHSILAGNHKHMEKHQISFDPRADAGTKVYIAIDGHYAGCIVIADELREDSAKTIRQLRAGSITKTVMLTGDNEDIAKDVAQKVGVDEYHAGLLPDQKVERFESLVKTSTTKDSIAFVGDGINDAPVLARADVGIAMGALGSDAAIEAADVVLMTDEPSKLLDAFQVAHRTHAIVIQNISFALSVKFAFLVLGALGIAGLWHAVFADVGVMVLAVLNSMRMLKK